MSFWENLFGGNSTKSSIAEEADYSKPEGVFKDDRDGSTYSWAMIGSQIWMTENVRYKCKTGCWKSKNEKKDGFLYARASLEIACPSGWRLPTKRDYEVLVEHYGGEDSAGSRLRQDGDSGFNAIACGRRYDDGRITNQDDAYYWTATEDDQGLAWFIRIEEESACIRETWDEGLKAGMGTSLRCIKA